MRTTFRAKEPYTSIFRQCAADYVCSSPARPTRFIEKMKTNQGTIGAFGFGLDEEGLERKNPVIVGLGDSVTAGHFESLLPTDPKKLKSFFASPRLGPVEIADARESYLEKFRLRLIDKFEFTSVSAINAGIAGDNLVSMAKRADRDVIRYQPDLVLINGVLNWGPDLGTTAEFKAILAALVRRIKAETEADIILLTPNGDVANKIFAMQGRPVPEPSTSSRAAAVREVAAEEQVCLADVYAVWEAAREAGVPWEELLANGINHPGVEGHEVYAEVLMKLFE